MNVRTILRSTFGFVASLLFVTAAHSLAPTGLFRAYLAMDGLDSNPCTLPAPCRLLPAALAAVANGGEIWMLDSANYNTATVTIDKSVSILAVPGAVGSVLAIGGPAMSIATGGVKVRLTNLVILPLPGSGGTHGVYMTNGASLTIQGCSISGSLANPNKGVYVTSPATVHVVDSVIRDSWHGVYLNGGAKATISNSKFLGNADVGIYVTNTAVSTYTSVAVNDTTLTGPNMAIYAWGQVAGSSTSVSVTHSTLSNGSYGLGVTNFAGASTVATIGYSMVFGNTTPFYNDGGTLESLGNNIVRNNGADSGVVTTVSLR